jgi:DNA-binding NarL/FixJ family response regulator
MRRDPNPSPGTLSRGADAPLVLVVATERPAVHEFFAGSGADAARFDPARDVAEQWLDLERASLAVVDFGLKPATAIETCRALHAARDGLPVAAVICCPHSLTPESVRALAAAGVTSMLDLQMTREAALRALRAVARGESVLHLSFGGRRRGTLADILAGRRRNHESDVRLLELVALGLPDHEIGRRLHLSPHTIKKHIETLRAETGARNRVELAAWAGRQGLYATPEERATF